MRRALGRSVDADDWGSEDGSARSIDEVAPLLSADWAGLAAPSQSLGDRSSPTVPVSRSYEDSYDIVRVFLCFIFPALGGMLYGFDIGVASMELQQLTDPIYSGTKWADDIMKSTFLQGVIISSGTIGALTGSLIMWFIADDLGRKRSLLLASLLYMVGAFMQFMAGLHVLELSAGFSILFVGSFAYGIACGFSMHGAPAYISEMAPTSIRGTLVSLKEAFVVLGVVAGYTGGYILQDTVGGWRYINLFAVIAGAVMCVGMYHLPYSARWLALKRRKDEAYLSFRFIYPGISPSAIKGLEGVITKEVANGEDNHRHMANHGGDAANLDTSSCFTHCYQMHLAPLVSSEVAPALVAGMGLVIFQQITGQPSVLYFADDLFAEMGVGTAASVVESVLKLVMTLLSTLIVDNYGRKLLLYIGIASMMVGLLVVIVSSAFPEMSSDQCASAYSDATSCVSNSACLWNDDCDTSCTETGYADNECDCCRADGLDVHKFTIIVGLGIYIAGYQIGFGPITWLIISEIFPLHARGKAISAAIAMNFLWNSVVSFLFPTEYEYLGAPLTFSIYLTLLAVAFAFVTRFVPETRGMSLEEIEEMIFRDVNMRRSRMVEEEDDQ